MSFGNLIIIRNSIFLDNMRAKVRFSTKRSQNIDKTALNLEIWHPALLKNSFFYLQYFRKKVKLTFQGSGFDINLNAFVFEACYLKNFEACYIFSSVLFGKLKIPLNKFIPTFLLKMHFRVFCFIFLKLT